jgi:hypothetical protein
MDMNELKLKHAEEVIFLYKEIKELKKDIDYLKNELIKCRKSLRFNSHKQRLDGHLRSREII